MNKLSTLPVKGFNDYYPEDQAFQNWLFTKMRKVSSLFGYEEYEGPIVEPVDIYEAKSGKDLVAEQTFQLTDRGARRLALRPELTPTLARMVAKKVYELPFPLRYFSIGPRFRYEAPQKGRGRQFFQWDIDLLGINTPEADAEIIAIAVRFFKSLGLTSEDVVIKINNRKYMDFKFNLLNLPKKEATNLFSIIDKKDKMSEENWLKLLTKEGLNEDQIKNLKYLLTDKDVSFESEELTELFSTLKDLGVASFIKFDPTIVRGLDYYAGTVFEARDKAGKFRAVLGGGRYDNLIGMFGNREVSGVGFACGDQVIKELLLQTNKYPKLNPRTSQILVTVFSEENFRDSLKLQHLLIDANIPTEIYPDSNTSLDKQLKYADRKKIPYAAILGPEEVNQNKIALKDLRSKEQKLVTVEELISSIKNIIA